MLSDQWDKCLLFIMITIYLVNTYIEIFTTVVHITNITGCFSLETYIIHAAQSNPLLGMDLYFGPADAEFFTAPPPTLKV